MSQLTTTPQAKPRRTKRPRPADFRPTWPEATEPVTVRLEWPPSLNHYWRTTVIGKHANTYISAEGKAYREAVVAEWRRMGVSFRGRLAVRIEAVFPDARARDLDNLCKALLDALAHAGAYGDDSQIKLLILHQERVEKPGWVQVTIGHKPNCARQGSLFETEF